MTKIYQLTKQMHETIKKINEKYKLSIQIYSNSVIYVDDNELIETIIGYSEKYISDTDNLMTLHYRNCIEKTITDEWQIAIQEKQIRHILRELRDILGLTEESKTFWKLRNELNPVGYNDAGDRDTYIRGWLKYREPINYQAESLCQKWLDGLNPLIDQDPEKVLEELLKTLKKIV